MKTNAKKLLFVALAMAPLHSHAATIVFSEDFSGYAASTALAGQGDWTTTGTSVTARASDTVGVGAQSSALESARNLSAMNLSLDTTSITIDVILRGHLSAGWQANFGILDAAGNSVFNIATVGGTGYRLQNELGANVFAANANTATDDDLVTSGHLMIANRFTYDFVSDTWSWSVRNTGGDANYTLLDSGTAADFGGTQKIADVANWRGVHIGAQSASDIVDNITITAVPEPSAALLGGLGLLALLRRRRA